MDTATGSELVGAHDGALTLTTAGTRATVKLDPVVRGKLRASLAAASLSAPPDRTYLQLENVRGTRDANKLTVYLNEHPAGVASLFGLGEASLKDGEHGGSGLTLDFDVTNIIDTLHLNNTLGADTLDVRIVPSHALASGAAITIGRVSLQRETHQ